MVSQFIDEKYQTGTTPQLFQDGRMIAEGAEAQSAYNEAREWWGGNFSGQDYKLRNTPIYANRQIPNPDYVDVPQGPPQVQHPTATSGLTPYQQAGAAPSRTTPQIGPAGYGNSAFMGADPFGYMSQRIQQAPQQAQAPQPSLWGGGK